MNKDQIPQSYYEAAEIDGAGGWHRFWYITLPGIRNMVIVMVTIHVLWTFNNFDFVAFYWCCFSPFNGKRGC